MELPVLACNVDSSGPHEDARKRWRQEKSCFLTDYIREVSYDTFLRDDYIFIELRN